jgi:hypothetical protein
LGGKSIGLNPKKEFKRLKFMIWRTKFKVGFNSKIQYASNESKLVPKNLDPSSKVGLNNKLATWNHERENELKFSFKISEILEGRNGWIMNIIHLNLLNNAIYQVQTNNIMPHTNLIKLPSFYGWITKLFKIY